MNSHRFAELEHGMSEECADVAHETDGGEEVGEGEEQEPVFESKGEVSHCGVQLQAARTKERHDDPSGQDTDRFPQ